MRVPHRKALNFDSRHLCSVSQCVWCACDGRVAVGVAAVGQRGVEWATAQLGRCAVQMVGSSCLTGQRDANERKRVHRMGRKERRVDAENGVKMYITLQCSSFICLIHHFIAGVGACPL